MRSSQPAFVGWTPAGNVALYFEMVADSAIGELFNQLCAALGHPGDGGGSDGNYCAIPRQSDTSSYGCYPEASEAGPFCLYADIIYEPRFFDDDDDGAGAAAYFEMANTVVDSWR